MEGQHEIGCNCGCRIGLEVVQPESVGLQLNQYHIGFEDVPTLVISGKGSSVPFVTTKDNLVQFFCSTLKQLERMMIVTSEGNVQFTITIDNLGTYHLAFSSTSPAPIAGVEIESNDAELYYNDYIFVNRLLTLPEGWTVSAVQLDNTENLLDVDNGWRLMDIQSTTRKLTDFFDVVETSEELMTQQEIEAAVDEAWDAYFGSDSTSESSSESV